ncbi:zinc finger, CCHC-type containing protein [Tanacetum coccineum]
MAKKMHFLLSSMSVVYVLTTPIPEDGGDDATVEQIRKRAKWDNDDYVCRGLILNGMSDSFFDIYQNVESSELWDSLEAKYMAEDASSKKFLVSNFTNYKMTNSRPVLEQYNELLGILGRFTQHKINMDEAIQVSCIIDKLPYFWKDFKHTLKHLKEELTLVELGSHLRIEESLRVQDSDKPKGNNVAGPSVVNMVEHNNSSTYNNNKGKRKYHDNTRDDPNKKEKPTCIKGSVDGSSNSLKGQNMFNKSLPVYYVTYVSEAYFMQGDDVAWWVKSGVTVHVCKDRCWFKTYESLNDGSILHMGNGSTTLVHGRGCVDLRLNIVNDNIASAFMSASKLNDSILWHARLGHVHFKRVQDMFKDGLILAFDMNIEKDVIFDENRFSSVYRPSLRIPNRTEYIDGLMVPKEVTEEDDLKIFDKAMKSQDVAFWKEAINDEMNSIMGNNTCVLADLPPCCKPLGCKWIFKRKLKYHKTVDSYGINSQSDYSLDGLLEGYTNASWINNTKDNSSTSGWVFLLGGGAISWASKKQTYITGSTMKSEFMALAAAGKETEWLKNLLFDIPLWVKPIAHISIHCDRFVSVHVEEMTKRLDMCGDVQISLFNNKEVNELCGYVLWKPSRHFTRPLGPTSGLKVFPAAIQMLLEEEDLEHGLEHDGSSSYRANPGE